jgi:hypothetical protein
MDTFMLKKVLFTAGDILSAKVTSDLMDAISGACAILHAPEIVKKIANSMVIERLSKRLTETPELTYYSKIALLDDCVRSLEYGDIDE